MRAAVVGTLGHGHCTLRRRADRGGIVEATEGIKHGLCGAR
jgi:hypothetical protein